jgi:hypothetical protein
MSETVNQHDYVEGKCQHCGDRHADNAARDRRCVSRIIPRSIPTSVFAEIDPIYQRILELRRERDAVLSTATLTE